ncbi:prepilin peptidase [Maritimibacter sp. HL-12]|jgi:prepilin peptidase CpaA|uniref:prepilin peptidase n=1 Tax=Maritimibacter sp. HL-12 TaxID=1162418 RepID=UPI000A0F2525|nr:prepilin peptidase [Maritimibacter sp. HL-12]SMH53022.1 prepilin peptidase CpaA [Maritimibacter sp. HL-12]
MTAQTAATALWFLPFVVPIAIWVAWSDMARMKIPNKAVLALVAVFAVVGLLALPLEVWAWRWVHLAVVLALGFVASSAGLMGAGDAKFAAAMAPFVLRADLIIFGYLLAAVVLSGFAIHRIARAMPWVRARTPGWESWERKDFPMGLCLGAALVFYLAIGAVWGA